MRFMRFTKITALILAMALVISGVKLDSYADGNITTTLYPAVMESGKMFTFKGMPYNGKYSPIQQHKGLKLTPRTTQNFALTPDGKYVFTTAEGDTTVNGKVVRHTILSRCVNPSSWGVASDANLVDTMVLDSYGHGETIEVTQPDIYREVYHIWVATKPTGGFYGLQIARLTYEVINGVGVVTKVVRLTNFRRTNVKDGKCAYFAGKPMPNRVNVAIDVVQNQIAFRVEFTNNTTNYLIYSFNDLNSAIDNTANGGSINMKDAAKWQMANLNMNAVPCNDYQSFHICDNVLYVAGGNVDKGAQIYAEGYTIYRRGKARQVNITNAMIDRIIIIQPQVTISADEVLDIGELELEGLKVYRDVYGRHNFFINFYMQDIPITSSIGVYRFTLDQTY